MERLLRRRNKELGASLVEFALVAPLLFMLLFGMVEFGWAFAQNLDIKHITREVGRLATVDGTTADIVSRACGGDIVRPSNVTAITRTGGDETDDTATVTVSATLEQITGMFNWAFGSGGTISSTVEIRLEQDATNWDGSNLAPCP
ncbi:MAG: TadE/TadG family type IV pilus assembly protein [Acidimicrobiia bacterium]